MAGLRAGAAERRLTVQPAAGARLETGGRTLLNFSSNDYLGLAGHPHVIAAARAALDRYGAGATASRLVCGTLPIHDELEERMARFKGYPAALLFGSGYLANAGVITGLCGKDDVLLVDRLAHASIIDAARQSGARLQRFHHNDVAHLRQLLGQAPADAKKMIVTESVFSMDGDLAPLPDLAAAAEEAGALLLVDEAHATGVFGRNGRGCIQAAGLTGRIPLSLFTLGKALGGYGGAVACPSLLRDWLVNKARSFIYTTALPPAVAGAALGALDVLEASDDPGAAVRARAARFSAALQAAGFDTLRSASPIVPLLVGDNSRALALSAKLRERGLLAIAIRPPTVPPGTARIRFSITAAHTDDEVDAAAAAVIAAVRETPP